MDKLNFKELKFIEFPKATDININMTPFIFGDMLSLPENLRQYEKIINECALEKNKIAYLTVQETFVPEGRFQRRSGIHTDGFVIKNNNKGWGGGWGSSEQNKGIYMASSDGRCKIWNEMTFAVDKLGALIKKPISPSIETKANYLYWLTDRTPHESLPATKSGIRQFFRLVSDKIDVWYSLHNTANPLGIKPQAKIISDNKFV